MKALSVKQPWANMIASGQKTYEIRSFRTKYRGPLLIASSKYPNIEPAGSVIALVNIYATAKFLPWMAKEACCEWQPDKFAWLLEHVTQLDPIPIKGQLGVYTPPDDIIEQVNAQLDAL